MRLAPPAALAALLLLWLAMLALGAGEVDRTLLLALYAGDEPGLALAAMGFTYLGDSRALIPMSLVAAALLAWRSRGREALLLLVASFTGRGLVVLEKLWFARLRPEEDLRLVEVSYLSFPSGHSANSMLVYVGIALLAFQDPQHRQRAVAAALMLTFLIGLSRPMLGVHWPSDVVGGWAFGAFWLLLVLWIGQRPAPAAVRR